jgi:hypothetical protein
LPIVALSLAFVRFDTPVIAAPPVAECLAGWAWIGVFAGCRSSGFGALGARLTGWGRRRAGFPAAGEVLVTVGLALAVDGVLDEDLLEVQPVAATASAAQAASSALWRSGDIDHMSYRFRWRRRRLLTLH